MQKRVVYNFNAQPATETATGHANGKAVKASNAIGKIKRAFFGKGLKLAVFVVLLFASLFCAIGSADWIISQQKDVPNAKDGTEKTFNVDDFGLDKYISISNSTYNGNPVCAEMKTNAVDEARGLPTKAIDKANVKYKVIPYEPSAKSRLLRAPQNAASTERNKAPAANAATSLPNEDDFKDIGYTTELPTNAGTYAVLITSEVKGVSYGKAIKVFTISQKELIVKAKDKTLTYGDPVPTFNETDLTYEGLLDCDIGKLGTPKFTCTYTTTSPVGSYDISVSGLNNLNYNISYQSGTLTVTQRTVTIAWGTKNSFVYDGNAHTRDYTAKNVVTGDNLGLTVTVTGENITGLSAINAGTYTATVKITNPNYVLDESSKTATFTITPRTVTLDWGANSFAYDGNAHTLTPTAQNAVSNDNLGLTVTVTGEKITDSSAINAGTYTATAKITNPNYVLDESSKTATFTITPRPLTVKAKDKTLTYGDPVPTFNETDLTYEGLLDCDKGKLGTPVFACAYTTTSPVGNYTIEVSGLANSNYTINYKSGTLTVNPGTIIVSVTGKTISYGDPVPTSYDLTCNNPDISISDLGTPVFKCGYTTKSPVGEYPITVTGLTLANYTIEYATGAKLIVRQREVTVSWGNTTFTYNGKEQKPVPSFNNVVNNDDLKANVSIDNNKQPIIKGTYTATVTISNGNYKLSGETSKGFTIKPLKIAFDGIIEHDYTDGGITLNGDLFKGKIKIAETIEDASSVNLPSVLSDVNGGTANNFSGTEDFSKPENGFYSYTFGKHILAGSTYLISGITLKTTSNFELTTDSIYLKYKTAKIEKTAENKTEFFTIEDALAESGDITLCGNIATSSASPNSSYVITAFAKLKNLPGTGFKNYKANYEYTLSGTNGSNRKLIVPFEDSLNEKTCLMKTNAAYGNVYSTLVIHNDISLKLSNSASITVGAELSYNQNISCALVERHGVLSNNGTITAESGCTVSAYGYIKGTGKIILKSGAIGNDVVSIYDFPGGAVILFNMSKVFPTNAFTLHNNACETYIYSGAKYTGFTYFVLDTPIVGNTGYESTAEIVGSNSKSGLFAPTSTSGYIIKKVTTLGNYNINDISETNQRTATNTKLQHRDNIEVYGSYKDNTMELSVKGNKFQTSTDKPFPIGLMDISIKEGELALEKSSYMVMPGSKLKVENGAKLTVNGKVKLSAIQYDTINSATGAKKYTNYFSTESDGEIIVNGELTTASTAQVGGKILSTEAAASIQLSNTSASYIMLIHTDKSNATLSGTVNAFGDIMTKQNNHSQQDFSTGTYYSTKIGSGYAWFKNSATITYNPKGGTLSGNTTQNITLPSGGYTDLPTPNRDYYTFDGWYFDPDLTQEATAIYTTCTLYAKWTPIQYTIQYTLPYTECGTLANGSLSGSEVKTLANPPQTITVDGHEYTFDGWYLNPDYSGEPITTVSAINANDEKIIKVYAFYRGGTYTVNYDENPKGLTFTSEIREEDKPASQVCYKGKTIPVNEQSLVQYNTNDSFNYYFAGWYLSTDSNERIISSLPNTINDDITLCAKWIKKRIIIVQKSPNETVNGITGGLGTFYVSPLDTTYATAVTCTLIENKERYTPKYSATNASVDANGVISFANSNSAEDVIINVTTQRWFMVDNQYTDKITLKLDSSTGTQDGNWFTENAKVTVTLKPGIGGTAKATIQKYDETTQSLNVSWWREDSKDIIISGWYVIKKA